MTPGVTVSAATASDAADAVTATAVSATAASGTVAACGKVARERSAIIFLGIASAVSATRC